MLNEIEKPVSRKSYFCNQCGVIIPVKTRYVRHTYTDGGELFADKMHTECYIKWCKLSLNDYTDNEWLMLYMFDEKNVFSYGDFVAEIVKKYGE